MNEKLNKNKNYKLVKIRKKLAMSILRTILIVGICFIILFPIIRAIVISITKYEYVALPNSIWIPWKTSGAAYKYGVRLLDYKSALFLTLGYSALLMFIQLTVAALAGYGLHMMKFKGSSFFSFCVILTVILPPQLIALPQYIFLSRLNLIDKSFAIYILALFGQGIRQGIFIYLFKQFYKGLPKELEEAAKMDGCGFFGTFFRIVLPNARSIIITVAVFSFVWNFGDTFYTGYFASKANLLPNRLGGVSEGLAKSVFYEFTGLDNMSKYYYPTILSAVNILYIAPLLIIYFIVQKSFVQSFENSGIVG